MRFAGPAAASALVAITAAAWAQETVSFPTADGGVVWADLYGKPGARGLVLAHGGRFDKSSWARQAPAFAAARFRVAAIDFRGRGRSHGGPQATPGDDGYRFDVMAAIAYLRQHGARTVSVVGASMGGDAAAEVCAADPRAVERIVLLAAGAYTPLPAMKGRKLYILSRDDFMGDDRVPRLPAIRAQFEKATEPRQMVLLDGSAHAQFLFDAPQGGRLLDEIVRFLTAP